MTVIIRIITIVIALLFTVFAVWLISWVFGVTRIEGGVAYLLMWVILWDARYLEKQVEKEIGRNLNPTQ